MPHPNPIFNDIDGAPFKIGQRVTIIDIVDFSADASLIGLSGTVDYFEYECGCGQTYPDDPMIGVTLASGQQEEFWREELKGETK